MNDSNPLDTLGKVKDKLRFLQKLLTHGAGSELTLGENDVYGLYCLLEDVQDDLTEVWENLESKA